MKTKKRAACKRDRLILRGIANILEYSSFEMEHLSYASDSPTIARALARMTRQTAAELRSLTAR